MIHEHDDRSSCGRAIQRLVAIVDENSSCPPRWRIWLDHELIDRLSSATRMRRRLRGAGLGLGAGDGRQAGQSARGQAIADARWFADSIGRQRALAQAWPAVADLPPPSPISLITAWDGSRARLGHARRRDGARGLTGSRHALVDDDELAEFADIGEHGRHHGVGGLEGDPRQPRCAGAVTIASTRAGHSRGAWRGGSACLVRRGGHDLELIQKVAAD